MTQTVTAAFISEALSCSKRAVQLRAEREHWAFEDKKAPGGITRFYAVETLPEHVAIVTKAKLLKLQTSEVDPVVDLPAPARATTPKISAASLTPEQQALAHARLQVLKEAKAFVSTKNGPRKAALAEFASLYADGAIRVEDSVRALVPKFHANTLINWETCHKAEGVAGISGAKYGQHRKGKGQIDNDKDVKEFIFTLITNKPHVNCVHVMRAIRARFKDEPKRVPSISKVRRFVEAWKKENEQVLLHLTNPDAWRNKFRASAGDAAAHVSAPNEEWQLDSTPTDVMLGDKRHAVLGVIDVFTRRVMFHVAKTSSAAGVAALIRRAILAWGVPQRIKTDNGTDYKAKHIALLCDELKIEQRFCVAYSPDQKPFIERVFKTFQHKFVELLPGYIGHSVADRQDIRARTSFADRREGKVAEGVTLTPAQFQEACDRWAEYEYARSPHEGLGGKSPFEVYTNWRGATLRVNERALDILLMPAADGDGLRVVGKTGIKVAGAVYNAAELGGLEGQRVFVRVDDGDLGRVFVFDADNQFLCIAKDPSITGISRSALAQARKARQAGIMTEARKTARRLATNLNIENIGTEILDHAMELAAPVVALPKPSEAYETEGLDQAAVAAATAKEDETPVAARKRPANENPMTDEEKAAWFGGASSVPLARYVPKAIG
jgi:transposase InsO family protein